MGGPALGQANLGPINSSPTKSWARKPKKYDVWDTKLARSEIFTFGIREIQSKLLFLNIHTLKKKQLSIFTLKNTFFLLQKVFSPKVYFPTVYIQRVYFANMYFLKTIDLFTKRWDNDSIITKLDLPFLYIPGFVSNVRASKWQESAKPWYFSSEKT